MSSLSSQPHFCKGPAERNPRPRNGNSPRLSLVDDQVRAPVIAAVAPELARAHVGDQLVHFEGMLMGGDLMWNGLEEVDDYHRRQALQPGQQRYWIVHVLDDVERKGGVPAGRRRLVVEVVHGRLETAL